MQSSAISFTFVLTSKNNTRIRHPVKKKKKLSLCLFVFVRDGNLEMMSQSKVDPLSCIVIHGPKKAQLPYCKKVQHLKEKYRAKTFLPK